MGILPECSVPSLPAPHPRWPPLRKPQLLIRSGGCCARHPVPGCGLRATSGLPHALLWPEQDATFIVAVFCFCGCAFTSRV